MKNWSLRFRFSIYAGTLTAIISLLSLAAIKPMIYQRQLQELDAQLKDDAAEVFGDLSKYGGSAINFRKPISVKFIPASLRLRYLQLNGPEGQQLYRSSNLRATELGGRPPGVYTLLLSGQQARIGTFTHGYLTVHIGTRLGRLDEMQEDLLHVMFWVAPAAGLVAFAVGWLLADRAVKPVMQLTQAAEKIQATQPDQRLPLPTAKDEIYRLSEVLNHTFDRLQQAYDASERFSADASHQLKTPLAVLRLGLERMRGAADTGPQQREEITQLEKQTRRLTTLVEDLLLLAQADAGRLILEPIRLDLHRIVAAMAEDLELSCESKGITFESAMQGQAWVQGDARRIDVILQNLAENALKYTPEGGRIKLECLQVARNCCVRLHNTGSPISDEAKTRIFQRFHRGDAVETTSGHGLGLNLARSLAKAQGGDIQLCEPTPGWISFEFWLPVGAE